MGGRKLAINTAWHFFLFFFGRRRPKEVEEMGTKERAKGDNSFHTVVVNVTSQEPHASQYGRQTDREGERAADFPIIERRKGGKGREARWMRRSERLGCRRS